MTITELIIWIVCGIIATLVGNIFGLSVVVLLFIIRQETM